MSIHPPEARLVHRLPAAPYFVGRQPELEALRAWWGDGLPGVLALVGLGGAGKTAVAARFLDELLGSNHLPRPEGLFVWSFYQDPDAGRFLEEAYHYFSRGVVVVSGAAVPPQTARGSGLLHLLRDALAVGGPHLLILDGLEKVQRQEGGSAGDYGQIEDPLLRGLLTRIAEGMGQTGVLITTRFPVTDLARFARSSGCAGYRHLDVGGLDQAAASSLLRARGVQGEDAVLGGLVESYGAHPLTLDHLGGLIGQFLAGDPSRAPEAPALTSPNRDRQALRLARLLRAYEEHLPPTGLTLLCRLCLLRRSVTEDQIAHLFLCSPAVHARTVRELGGFLESACPVPKGSPTGPGTTWHSRSRVPSRRLSLRRRWPARKKLSAKKSSSPRRKFWNFTSGKSTPTSWSWPASTPTHRWTCRRTDAPSRPRIGNGYGPDAPRYLELAEHPLLPFKEKLPEALEEAFQILGWSRPRSPRSGDLEPSDVMRAFQQVRQQLRYLTGKHFALQRVRELCRAYQRKWSAAGALAPLDAAALHRSLDVLVGWHLIVREGDGSFSIHPAVRDHFSRLAAASDQGAWHDLIREQMMSLVRRPGQRLPEQPAMLDLVEEAIYHAVEGGRVEEAVGLYNHVLGGLRHLGWKLGEMTRGLRILLGFSPCPDRWALAWFQRALGELDEAYRNNPLPCFRADIRLLQGRLPEVAAEGDPTRTPLAHFLMGQANELPPDVLGAVMPRDQLLLYLDRLDRARRSGIMEPFYKDIGWESDRARCQLIQAEVALRQADRRRCRDCLDAAAQWILHAGSVEHLCLMHLVRSRVARSDGELILAQRALDEGLHLAGHCGLGMYHVDLLSEQAEVFLAQGNAVAAEAAAREALQRASAAECQLQWAAAEAGHLLGQALALQQHDREARAILDETLDLRIRLGDPRREDTERLLERLK